ncbi:MAG: hypothetical protein ABIF09_06040 [Gemmatimonadota bacterium]
MPIMEPGYIFRLLIIGTLAFSALLLSVPIIQVAKSRPWRDVVGLWVAGWGFLLIAVGLFFADQGLGGVVVIGVATAAVGHFLQSRYGGGRGPRTNHPS